MYYVLVGGGSIGYFLAQLFLEEEHEVIVIEKDQALAQKISDDLDIITIMDDATKESVLEEAGIRNADALIVITDSDETNLVVGMLGKQLGAKKVAIRLTKTDYNKEFLTKIGVDVVFNPESAAAGYIEEMLTKPDVLDLAFLSRGSAEIIEVEVTTDSPLKDKTVKEASNKRDGVVVAIFDTEGGIIIPQPEAYLREGYKVLLLIERKKK